MNLLMATPRQEQSGIEQELKSNDRTPEERQETEMLFGLLRHARNAPGERKTLSPYHGDGGLKGWVLKLLYAGGSLGLVHDTPRFLPPVAGDGASLTGSLIPATGSAAPQRSLAGWNPLFERKKDAAAVMESPHLPAPGRVKRDTAQGETGRPASLERQNQRMAGLFNLTDSALSEMNGLSLVDCAARSLIDRPESMAKMAFTLLRDSGLYGASPGERLTENVMGKIVNDWITENLFGSDLVTYVATLRLHFESSQDNSVAGEVSNFDVKACRERIQEQLRPLQEVAEQVSGPNERTYRYVLDNVVAPVLPTLFFNGADALEIGALDWCYLHIGLSVTAKSAVSVQGMTLRDMIEIGCSLSAMLMMGSLPPVMTDLFTFPALLYFLTAMSDEDKRAALQKDLRGDGIIRDALGRFFRRRIPRAGGQSFQTVQRRHERLQNANGPSQGDIDQTLRRAVGARVWAQCGKL
ncbi:hypothetical protein ABK905_13080 [Acerihabitans sp. KWT182]|uniref:Uncharacterized protein n=1 Tax=Acerihabitans sp. KWT182 TaxID=3157919 RepID=A0AAU7QFA9_9GAMM